MKPLHLVCFGLPTVSLDGCPAEPDDVWRRPLARLAHLSLSPDRTRTRTLLVGLLWSGKTSDAASHSLNEAARRRRAARALGAARWELGHGVPEPDTLRELDAQLAR